LIGRRPTVIDLVAINLMTRWLGIGSFAQTIEIVGEDENDPEMQFGVFYALGGAWLSVFPVFALPWTVIAFLLDRSSLVGPEVSASVLVAGGAFCLAGCLDALWRNVVVMEARRRYRSASGTLDDASRRLLRIAQVNDATILIQLGAAVLAYRYWR